MVKIILSAPTLNEATAKRDAYLAEWPPQGYSTTIGSPKFQEPGKWTCVGWRGTHCD